MKWQKKKKKKKEKKEREKNNNIKKTTIKENNNNKNKNKQKNNNKTTTTTTTTKKNLCSNRQPFQNVIDLLFCVRRDFHLKKCYLSVKNKRLTVGKTLLYWSPYVNDECYHF